MSQHPNKIMIEYSLEELRCSLCTAYLSCAPIMVLPDGNSICGHCSVDGQERQTYRNLRLEAMLTNTFFPCRYKINGCEEHLVFDYVEEHDAKCAYRAMSCPLFTVTRCVWKGAADGVLDHVTTRHPSYVAEKAEFIWHVDQNIQTMLVVPVNNVVFVVNFKYTASNSHLHYSVNYFTYNLQGTRYNIKLLNNVDQDYCITLKGDDCFPIDVYRRIEIDFSVNISKISDNDLLQTSRCAQCQGYLIPPLFDSGKGAVCVNCSKTALDCKPLNNNELNENVAKAHYPCYWIGCNIIAGAAYFQPHMETCPFRVYECILNTCKESFKREQAIAHLEGHGYEFFHDRFDYKLVLATDTPLKRITTFENNGIISVQYETRYDEKKGKRIHKMRLAAFGTSLNNLALKVQFAHNHCKLKSKLFSLAFTSEIWWFYMEHFPACFKQDEELTVMIKMGNSE